VAGGLRPALCSVACTSRLCMACGLQRRADAGGHAQSARRGLVPAAQAEHARPEPVPHACSCTSIRGRPTAGMWRGQCPFWLSWLARRPDEHALLRVTSHGLLPCVPQRSGWEVCGRDAGSAQQCHALSTLRCPRTPDAVCSNALLTLNAALPAPRLAWQHPWPSLCPGKYMRTQVLLLSRSPDQCEPARATYRCARPRVLVTIQAVQSSG
jgi:hypothetical protein